MSDSAWISGYLGCHVCGSSQGPVVSLEFYGNGITKKVLVPCECGHKEPVYTKYQKVEEEEE